MRQKQTPLRCVTESTSPRAKVKYNSGEFVIRALFCYIIVAGARPVPASQKRVGLKTLSVCFFVSEFVCFAIMPAMLLSLDRSVVQQEILCSTI